MGRREKWFLAKFYDGIKRRTIRKRESDQVCAMAKGWATQLRASTRNCTNTKIMTKVSVQ